MKSSIILASALALGTSVFSACGGGVNTTPNKPETKPTTPITVTPVTPTQPAPSPSVDPKASPAKPGTALEVKKDDKKPAETPKEIKPAEKGTPKK